MRFTADHARRGNWDELDGRIKRAVRGSVGNSATMRVYIEDSFLDDIQYELERRGFTNVQVPSITLKGDVYFEWDEE